MANEAHVRIDEGIKRGPKNARKPPRRSPKADLGTWVIPDGLNPHEVIRRFLTEATTSHISAQYGLSRKALVKWLRTTVPVEWKEAQTLRALCRKEDGEDGIDVAEDALSLACAREQVKSAQWELERLDSANYGQKQEVTVVNEVKIVTVLDGDACALLTKLVASKPNGAVLQPDQPIIDVTPDT